MDSPKREPCFSPCDLQAFALQGSPLFKFLCSLSPIKQAKTGHVAQTYSELSFPAPLPVFVSPRAREKREASTTNGGGSEEPPRRVVTHDALLRLANCAHSMEEAVARQSSPVEQPKPTSLPEACSDLSFHPAPPPPPPPPEIKEECEESVDEVPPEPVITQEDLNTTACAQTVEELQRPAVTQESLFKSTICVRIVEEVQAVCTQEVIQTTRCEGQPVGTQEGVMKSATCVRSLTFGIQQALEECIPFDMDSLVTPERRRLSLQSDSMDGEKSRTPKKKRKSVSSADGCKRCHCKKSKCLKLYCECFAAGVYCLDSCACRDCFNKPEFSETVLGTRQQIETRNPLAFAPKIVQTSEPCPAATEGISCPDTLASARHKRGCNCKKSMCLKKYCECYQAGVGCSDGCRCNGCKNIYGMKKVQEDPDQAEDPSSITVTSISPITPTFPHPPGLLDSAEFRRIYESASSTVVQSCTPEGSTEQPSPRWEGLEDICTITPLAQRPPLPTSSLLVKSEPPQSPFSKPSESPSYPTSSHSCFLPSDLTSTPPSPPPTTTVGKLMDPSCQLASDESPEFLREDRSPRTILKGSPKQKRVVPPNTSEFTTAPSSVSRGRKLTLQTLPSLPPVTPFSFSQQGYRRS